MESHLFPLIAGLSENLRGLSKNIGRSFFYVQIRFEWI